MLHLHPALVAALAGTSSLQWVVLLTGCAAVIAVQTTITPSCTSAAGGCVSALQAAFAACRGEDSCDITLTAGSYPVVAPTRSIAVNAVNLRNVTISGYGAELVLQNLTGAFAFEGIDGLFIAGLSVDMLRQPYVE